MKSILHIPVREEEKNLGDSVFANAFQNFSLPEDEAKLTMDIFQTQDEIVILVPIAGIDPKKVQITLTEDVLTISGERIFPEEMFAEERSSFLNECYWGKFSRNIVLPEEVNAEKAVAKVKNSLLMVRIPKVKKSKSRVIPVEVQKDGE